MTNVSSELCPFLEPVRNDTSTSTPQALQSISESTGLGEHTQFGSLASASYLESEDASCHLTNFAFVQCYRIRMNEAIA